MIDKNRIYKTRDGREVRIYATDGANERVHGAIKNEHGWAIQTWCNRGIWLSGEESTCDLIEVRPRHQRTVWLNAYNAKECMGMHLSKERADASALEGRIACIKVDLDFAEGDGL